MKTCPKCKTQWSDKAQYCICGTKLDDVIDAFLDMATKAGVDPEYIKEMRNL